MQQLYKWFLFSFPLLILLALVSSSPFSRTLSEEFDLNNQGEFECILEDVCLFFTDKTQSASAEKATVVVYQDFQQLEEQFDKITWVSEKDKIKTTLVSDRAIFSPKNHSIFFETATVMMGDHANALLHNFTWDLKEELLKSQFAEIECDHSVFRRGYE